LEEIEANARGKIWQRVSRHGAGEFQDQGDEHFDGYVYGLCWRNLRYACLDAVTAQCATDKSLKILFARGCRQQELAITPSAYRRAVQIAIHTVRNMLDPQKRVMKRMY